MNKLAYLLSIISFLLLSPGSASAQIRVCKGQSFDEVVYTIDDPRFLKGESSEVLYTIRGKTLCEGTTYDVVFTRRDDIICPGITYEPLLTKRGWNFCQGESYDVVYTYRDNRIYNGTSFDDVLYTFRDGEPTETVIMYMMAILYTTRDVEGAGERKDQ